MPGNTDLELSLEYVRDCNSGQLLSSILTWIDATKPKALRHPLGFFVVLLARVQDQEWRFHVWPKGNRVATGIMSTIHTHDKVVESKVLTGALCNILYSVSEVTEEGLPVYEVGYMGDKYQHATSTALIRTDRIFGYREKSRQKVRAGEMYRIESHEFHEAVVSTAFMTCTIVCMHSQAPGPIFVLGSKGEPKEVVFRREECSSETLKQFFVMS